jgi:hypothetical protein
VSTGISRFGYNHRKPPDIVSLSPQKVQGRVIGLKNLAQKNIADFRNSCSQGHFSTGFTGIRILRTDGIDGIENRPDRLGGCISPPLIAQIVALKLGGKWNAIGKAAMMGTTDGRGDGKGGSFKKH